MTDFVVDGASGSEAHGVDLVDGDAPVVRLIVHGDLPTTIEHDGRTWIATGGSDTPDPDAPSLAVYRPTN
ncbi:hypothetical protein [Curtobacterium sp. Leaf261]|uniref:hypothetical protein n=1 Tax=Curtobacterium sp. Leaf261 TaxID=1736311 RepID=UPI0006F8662C|nr:hypothetical protein [Curtobacterium sp. Leaf261]KQO59725.1 hypothetical protein ASF23_15645 [Curtobacterium sp. Leaf261]